MELGNEVEKASNSRLISIEPFHFVHLHEAQLFPEDSCAVCIDTPAFAGFDICVRVVVATDMFGSWREWFDIFWSSGVRYDCKFLIYNSAVL